MKKIVFITHKLAFNFYGGAETQIEHTIDSINNLNSEYEAKLYDSRHDKLSDFDIIHLFMPHMYPLESVKIIKHAKSLGAGVAISPIFFSNIKYSNRSGEKNNLLLLLDNIVISQRWLMNKNPISYLDPFRNTRIALEEADVLLPNSKLESSYITNFFNLSKNNHQIVPNGVDLRFKNGNETEFIEKFGISDFILFVGRIEKIKNVINLIKAYRKSGISGKLVIIGNSFHKEYFDECKSVATDNVVFLEHIPYNSSLLSSAYKAAKVVVLPSYSETVGLTALEGGLAGANVVVTAVGGTKEYFSNYVNYIDPFDEDSIRTALVRSFNEPKNNRLSIHIENNYSWNNVAKKTIAAYNKLIKL